MKLTKRQLRRIIREERTRLLMESPPPRRSSFEVMDLLFNLTMDKMRAWAKETLPVKKVLTSEEQAEASMRFKKEAFEEINPPEFKTLEELSTAFDKDLKEHFAKIQQDLNDRIAIAKAAEQKKLDTSTKGPMGGTQV